MKISIYPPLSIRVGTKGANWNWNTKWPWVSFPRVDGPNVPPITFHNPQYLYFIWLTLIAASQGSCIHTLTWNGGWKQQSSITLFQIILSVIVILIRTGIDCSALAISFLFKSSGWENFWVNTPLTATLPPAPKYKRIRRIYILERSKEEVEEAIRNYKRNTSRYNDTCN